MVSKITTRLIRLLRNNVAFVFLTSVNLVILIIILLLGFYPYNAVDFGMSVRVPAITNEIRQHGEVIRGGVNPIVRVGSTFKDSNGVEVGRAVILNQKLFSDNDIVYYGVTLRKYTNDAPNVSTQLECRSIRALHQSQEIKAAGNNEEGFFVFSTRLPEDIESGDCNIKIVLNYQVNALQRVEEYLVTETFKVDN